MTDGIELDNNFELKLDLNPDEGMRKQADLNLMNQKTFDLVQTIQKYGVSSSEKQQAFDDIKQLSQLIEIKRNQFITLKEGELKMFLSGLINE